MPDFLLIKRGTQIGGSVEMANQSWREELARVEGSWGGKECDYVRGNGGEIAVGPGVGIAGLKAGDAGKGLDRNQEGTSAERLPGRPVNRETGTHRSHTDGNQRQAPVRGRLPGPTSRANSAQNDGSRPRSHSSFALHFNQYTYTPQTDPSAVSRA
ncbi:unnamed protein product [Calypogeia fissa]